MRTCFIAMVFILCAGAGVLAGWDAAVWPAYEHPAQTDRIESNLVDQVNRRRQSLGWPYSNTVVSISWWRSRSSNLASIKSNVRTMMQSGKFAWFPEDPIQYVASNAAMRVLITSNMNAALAAWQLPTNALDYTPWRDLSGVGGFTNDLAVVGHPHGVTNAITARGGTNFPGSRTCWYTTDYGWDVIKTICEHLTSLSYVYNVNDINEGYHYGNANSYPGHEQSYASAILQATTTRWGEGGNGFVFSGVGQYVQVDVQNIPTKFDVWAGTHDGTLRAYNMTIPSACTSWVRSCDIYLCVTNETKYSFETNGFDGQSYGWTSNWNVVSGFVSTNRVPSYEFAVTSPPPNWPTFPQTNYSCAMGWKLIENKTLPIVVTFDY